jgi:PKD repeat protein
VDAGELDRIDPATDSISTLFPTISGYARVTSFDSSLEVSPDGLAVYEPAYVLPSLSDPAYVPVIARVNSQTGSVTHIYSIPRLAAFTMSPDGRSLFALSYGTFIVVNHVLTITQPAQLLTIDTDSGAVTGTADITGQLNGRAIVASRNGRVYTLTDTQGDAYVSTFDSTSGAMLDSFDVNTVVFTGSSRKLAASPDGTRLFMTTGGGGPCCVGSLYTFDVTGVHPVKIRQSTLGPVPVSLTVSPDGTRVYVADVYASTVAVVDTNTGGRSFISLPGSSDPGSNPLQDIDITADGKKLYVLGIGAGGDVYEIDAATNTYVGSLHLKGVDGLAATPPRAGPPVADFSWASTGDGQVEVDASGSHPQDASTTIQEYDWNFGDGQQLQTSTPQVPHTFEAPGRDYTVTLTVIDSAGNKSDPVSHEVMAPVTLPVKLMVFLPANYLGVPSPEAYCLHPWNRIRLRPFSLIYAGDYRGFDPRADMTHEYRAYEAVTLVADNDGGNREIRILPGTAVEIPGVSHSYVEDGVWHGAKIGALNHGVRGLIDPSDDDGVLHDCELLDNEATASGLDTPDVTPGSNATSVQIHFEGHSAMPLLFIDPPIDWKLDVDVTEANGVFTLKTEGSRDNFPAYEIYAADLPVYRWAPSTSIPVVTYPLDVPLLGLTGNSLVDSQSCDIPVTRDSDTCQ